MKFSKRLLALGIVVLLQSTISSFGFSDVVETIETLNLNVAPEDVMSNTVWKRVQGEDFSTFVQSKGTYYGLSSDGTVVAFSDDENRQIVVRDWEDIIDLKSNGSVLVGLQKNGKLVIGNNRHGNPVEIGNVDEWEDIIKFDMDDYVGRIGIIALKSDGTVYSYSADDTFMESYEVTNEWANIVDVCVNKRMFFGITEDGKVIRSSSYGFDYDHDETKKVVKIAARGHFQSVLYEDGTVASNMDDESIKKWENIVKIVQSHDYLLGLTKEGTLNVCIEKSSSAKHNTESWSGLVDVYGDEGMILGVTEENYMLSPGYITENATTVYTDVDKVFGMYGGFLVLQKDDVVSGFIPSHLYQDLPCVGNSEIDKVVVNSDSSSILTKDGKVYHSVKDVGDVADYKAKYVMENTSSQGNDYYEYDDKFIFVGDINNKSELVWEDIVDIFDMQNVIYGIRGDGGIVGFAYQNKLNSLPVDGECLKWDNVASVVDSDGEYYSISRSGQPSVDRYFVSERVAEEVSRWSNIKKIEKEYDFVLGLKNDGTITASGEVHRKLLIELGRYTNAVDLLADYASVYILTEDGYLDAYIEGSVLHEKSYEYKKLFEAHGYSYILTADNKLLELGYDWDEDKLTYEEKFTGVSHVEGDFVYFESGTVAYIGYDGYRFEIGPYNSDKFSIDLIEQYYPQK